MNSPFRPKTINVPGVLSDDAFQQQLKQYTDQQNAIQDSAPAPDSAVDFASKIQDEYLKAPTPSIARSAIPAALPGPLGLLASGIGQAANAGPPQETEQDRLVRLRSDLLSQAIGSIPDTLKDSTALSSTPFGAALGLPGMISQAGTLTDPADRKAAAEQQLADAKMQQEADANNRAATAQSYNDLSDEELMASVPGASTPEQARAALALSEQTGAETQKMFAGKTAEKQKNVDTPARQPTQTWWLNAIQNGVKGVASIPIGASRGFAEAAEMARDISGVDLLTGGGRSNMRAWIDTVDQTMNKLLPGDKARAKDFVTQLSQGTGSMLGFLMGGYAAAAAGVPSTAATTILGAATGGDQAFQDAENFNATTLQKYMAFIIGSGIGTTEAIPIDRMFMRADQATGGLVRRMLNHTLAGSLEEFIQETGQQMGQDVLAKFLYDPNRKMDVGSWLKAGAIGALSGGLAGAATTGLHEAGVTHNVAPPEITDLKQREQFVNQAITTVQGAIDKIIAPQPQAEALPNIAPSVTTVQGEGGTIPVNRNGKFEATHHAAQPLAVIDPAMRGTGPLRGQERERLFGPDAVDRSYFGVGDPNFGQNFKPSKEAPYKTNTDPYHGEGLGAFQHTIETDPNKVYNWFEDPLNLKSQLDRTSPASEQVTRYEKLIKDAGFEGIYFSESPLGQTALMFNKTTPTRVVNQLTGLRENFQVPTAPNAFHGTADATDIRSGGFIHDETANDYANDAALGVFFSADRGIAKQFGEDVVGARVALKKPFVVSAAQYLNRLNGWTREQFIAWREELKRQGYDGVEVEPSKTPLDKGMEQFNAKTYIVFDPAVATQASRRAIANAELTPEDLRPLPGLTTGAPVKSVVQAARAYAEARGLPVRRQSTYVKADPERGRRIAEAYAAMKDQPNNPKVKRAYKAMIDETLAQYQFVKATGLKIEAIEPGMKDPYPEGPKQVLEDLQRGHLWFFPTESGFGTQNEADKRNPLLAPTNEKIGDRTLLANDVFRIVHDFFGHGIEGSGFGARGEENAWQSHMRLYSQAALPAVTSETRGQNSWVNFGPHGEANRANQKETVYADQKTGIMPAWTWQEGVADEANATDLLAQIAKPEKIKELTDQVPGLKGVLKHLTPDEKAKLKKQNAAQIVDIFTNLPDPKEMAAVAFSGRAKRGWYRRSAEALVNIFGLNDAPRFAALLAALSPQTSVESNAINALNMWTNWVNAGRPTSDAAIRKLLGKSVQGGKGEASVLPAWINNTMTALLEPDALNIKLSGPKVDSFMRNLWGEVNAVTNDAWMANFANVDQSLFRKTGPSPGKGPGYIAMSAAVRKAAEVATQMTGERWTPAEIQETVWSWAKTLHDKAYGSGFAMAGKVGEAERIIKAGDLTAEEIGNTPDFASLFVSGVYRKILEAGGYNLDTIAAGSSQSDGSAGQRSNPLSAEGSGLAQRTFEKHLKDAAKRLDELRQQRAQAELNQSVPLDETFFPDNGAARQSELDRLSAADRQFLDEEMLANRMGTSNSRQPVKGEPTRPAQGVASQQGAQTSDVSLAQLSKNLIGLMDLTARQGRITIKGPGVLGQYSRKQDVIRVKTWNDFSTLAHEAGHALYFDASDPLKIFIAGHDAELMDVATKTYGGDVNKLPKAEHIAEGFAELFRLYTTNRAYAQREFPTVTRDFEAVLDQNAPELKQGLDLIGQQFAAWLQLPSVQLVRNMIVPGAKEVGINAAIKELRDVGFGTWMQEYTRKTVDGLSNRYTSVNAIVRDLLNLGQENKGKAIDLKRSEDPRILIRLAQNAGARAMVQASDGIMGYHGLTPESRSLRDALLLSQGLKIDDNLSKIDPVKKQDFAAYLVALRGIDEYRRFAEGKIERPPLAATLGDLQQTVQELNATYPKFAEAAQVVNEYGMALWKKSYDAGLMDKETYTDGLDRQFYAPLQRDMSDRKASLGASALTNGASIVKRFRGSDRNIVDPMDVLLHKTFATEQIIAKNDVAKALGRLADRAGRAGALVERIPSSQLIGKQYSVKEIARQLTKDDTISASDAQDLMEILQASIEDDNMLSLFRAEQASTKGENVLFYWEDGRLSALQVQDGDVGADLVNVMNGLGRENMPMFVNLIAQTSAIFRSSIVSWPDFLITNFIRDQMSAFILTDVGYKPFVTGLRGVFDELRQRQWARQYNASMGIMGGMNVAALHEARVNRDLNSLRKKGYIARAFTSDSGSYLGAAAKGMAHVVELTETGTRLGLYRAAFNRAKADGLGDWDAAIEAGYTATDYIDFGLNGSRMLLFRKTIPFLNAQIRGLDKMLRTLGGDEVRQRLGLRYAVGSYFKSINNLDLSRTEKMALQTGRKAWIKMASLGLISAALHFLFEDDPDYQEAGEYLRTTGWVIPLGNGRIFYIPKPFELAMVANFTERGIEAASGDPQAKFRFMRGLAMTLSPPTAPPAIQTAIELAANKDFFTGREIVPGYMQALQPQLQYDNYTTQLAKQIGQATGLSPMVVDHIMSSLGASAYRDLTTMYNSTDPNRPALDATDVPILRRFVRDVRRGSVSAQDFWKIASTVDGSLRTAEVTYKDYLAGGNTRAADEFLLTLSPDERAYAILATNFKADAKRLNPFYRARQVTTIVSAMRREMVSDMGLEDTTTKLGDTIKLSATEKQQLDDALSEYARREMRNTLIAEAAPGWGGKKVLGLEPTHDIISAIDPRVSEELDRRLNKAKVYNFDIVNEYWPEVRDRLNRDRENTFLKDILTIAKVAR